MSMPITSEVKYLAEKAMKHAATAISMRYKPGFEDNWYYQKLEKQQWAQAHSAIHRIEKLVGNLEDYYNTNTCQQ